MVSNAQSKAKCKQEEAESHLGGMFKAKGDRDVMQA